MGEFFTMIGNGISDFFSSIGNAIATALSNLVGMLMYYITKGLMFLVGLLQQLFDVFSGATKVQYEGEYTYLADVFFQNQQVQNIYWAVALLGIALVIMFTIISVVRKMFDLGDKHQNQSMGSILGSTFKSILTMLLLSFALNAALSITNVVINRIGYIFDHADSFSRQQEIHFTDEQFAAMGRVYTTIGNYSLNPSYDSRYNLNKCYNEVRGDLNYLERQGVFDFVYTTTENKETVETWQSTLQKLIYATNTSQDVPMDKYNEEVSEALLEIMDVIKRNPKFYPLKDYENGYISVENVGLDRVLFLSGTSGAANNEVYNRDPYLLDGLRGAFYTGERSIYHIDEVKDAFNIGIGGISYIFIWVLAYFTIRNLLRCIFGCIMRIFNMVSLYIVAPFAIAPMPLDDGEKFRQWTMAMVIQVLGILGTIIPMRLIILFAPIVMLPELVLFDSGVLNFFGKVLLIVGGLQAVEGFSSMITGILANNTSMASLNAGSAASAMGDQVFGMGTRAVGGAASFMGGAAADVTGLSWVNQKAGGLLSAAGGKMESLGQQGGVIGALVNKFRGGKSDAASGGGTPSNLSGSSGGDSTSNTPANLSGSAAQQSDSATVSNTQNNLGDRGSGSNTPTNLSGSAAQQSDSASGVNTPTNLSGKGPGSDSASKTPTNLSSGGMQQSDSVSGGADSGKDNGKPKVPSVLELNAQNNRIAEQQRQEKNLRSLLDSGNKEGYQKMKSYYDERNSADSLRSKSGAGGKAENKHQMAAEMNKQKGQFAERQRQEENLMGYLNRKDMGGFDKMKSFYDARSEADAQRSDGGAGSDRQIDNKYQMNAETNKQNAGFNERKRQEENIMGFINRGDDKGFEAVKKTYTEASGASQRKKMPPMPQTNYSSKTQS